VTEGIVSDVLPYVLSTTLPTHVEPVMTGWHCWGSSTVVTMAKKPQYSPLSHIELIVTCAEMLLPSGLTTGGEIVPS
jgi:hypothetical protein